MSIIKSTETFFYTVNNLNDFIKLIQKTATDIKANLDKFNKISRNEPSELTNAFSKLRKNYRGKGSNYYDKLVEITEDAKGDIIYLDSIIENLEIDDNYKNTLGNLLEVTKDKFYDYTDDLLDMQDLDENLETETVRKLLIKYNVKARTLINHLNNDLLPALKKLRTDIIAEKSELLTEVKKIDSRKNKINQYIKIYNSNLEKLNNLVSLKELDSIFRLADIFNIDISQFTKLKNEFEILSKDMYSEYGDVSNNLKTRIDSYLLIIDLLDQNIESMAKDIKIKFNKQLLDDLMADLKTFIIRSDKLLRLDKQLKMIDKEFIIKTLKTKKLILKNNLTEMILDELFIDDFLVIRTTINKTVTDLSELMPANIVKDFKSLTYKMNLMIYFNEASNNFEAKVLNVSLVSLMNNYGLDYLDGLVDFTISDLKDEVLSVLRDRGIDYTGRLVTINDQLSCLEKHNLVNHPLYMFIRHGSDHLKIILKDYLETKVNSLRYELIIK